MSLFGTLLRQGGKFADEALDASLLQTKKAPTYEEELASAIKADAEAWDEAAFTAGNPKPPSSAPEKEKVRWRNLKNKTKRKRELAAKRKVYVDKNKEKIAETRKKYNQENAAAIAEREREYRKKNAERIKAKQKETKKKNAAQIRETSRKWRERNRERHLANQSAWRDANRDRIREYNALQAPERKAALQRLKQDDPEAYEAIQLERRARAAERRSAVRTRTPKWSNQDAVLDVYRQAQELSRSTGTPYEVDHIIPLKGRDDTASGLHVRDNLLIVPRPLNRSKSNSFMPGDDPLRMNEVAKEGLFWLPE